MIRQLIIPGIVAGAAHVFVLLTPPEKPPPPPPPEKEPPIVIDLGKLPEIPPIENKQDPDPVEIPAIKLPVVFETIATNVESPFAVPFDPIIALPNLTGDNITVIPPGDYVEANRRGMGEGVRGLFRSDQLDNKPRTLFQGAPEYPYPQKTAGNPGEVVVTFTVDESGNVQDVRVVRSTHPDFEAPTVRAVSRWRFEPGRKDGRRVKFRMSVPVAFTLNDDN